MEVECNFKFYDEFFLLIFSLPPAKMNFSTKFDKHCFVFQCLCFETNKDYLKFEFLNESIFIHSLWRGGKFREKVCYK